MIRRSWHVGTIATLVSVMLIAEMTMGRWCCDSFSWYSMEEGLTPDGETHI